MTSHELSALTGAYALDSLDERERVLFETHLASCADCTEEVRSLRAAADQLSHLSAAVPPPQLRADVLAAIGRVRPAAPLHDNVVELKRRPSRARVWPALAAACALIAVAAVGWGVQQNRQVSPRDAQATAISRVLESPDAKTVTGAIGASGHAVMLYSKADHRMVLVAHGVPTPASDKTYQLWRIDSSGVATSAGLFTPNADGDVVVQASADLDSTAKIGISLEPSGGSPEPTPGSIVAVMGI